MSRQQTLTHFSRLLSRWPTDRLRPEATSFQRLLQSRITPSQSQPGNSPSTPVPHVVSDSPFGKSSAHSPEADRAEINAAYLLLDDTFEKAYKLSHRMMQPASDPAYYERLGKEIEEGPGRGVWSRLGKRLQGMIRWS